MKLPNIQVKLQTADADLYVDAAFELEVATERDKAAVHQRLSRLREAEIGILSGLTPADVRGSREIARTKERLLEKFRGVLPGHDLRALYVNSLIVD